MKRLVVILGVSLASMSQIFADGGKVPANVVVLDKATNSYVDIHEVTIGDWNIFLSFHKKSEVYYQMFLPNDEICRQAYKVDDYLTNPGFQNYPIVGITYEQAAEYCKWRTDNENTNRKKSNTTIYHYYLLTENELQNAYDLQTVKTSVKMLSAVDLKTKELTGIADNAREMTENKKVVVGEGANGLRFENYTGAASNLGFRCKLVLIDN
jgi:formylglycine-generating enzyme required for sulfatase activity